MIVSEFSKPCEEITITLTYREVLEITHLFENESRLSVGAKHSNLGKQFSALRVIIGGDSLDNLFLIGEEMKEC